MRWRWRTTQRRVRREAARPGRGSYLGEHVEQRAREDDVEAVERARLEHVAAARTARPGQRSRATRGSPPSSRLRRTRTARAHQRSSSSPYAPAPAADVEERGRARQPCPSTSSVDSSSPERAVRRDRLRVLELLLGQLEHLRARRPRCASCRGTRLRAPGRTVPGRACGEDGRATRRPTRGLRRELTRGGSAKPGRVSRSDACASFERHAGRAPRRAAVPRSETG